MNRDFFELYDKIIAAVQSDAPIAGVLHGDRWALVQTSDHTGIAMETPVDSIAPLCPAGLEGVSLRQAAPAIKSWNLSEASLALAAVNAACNTVDNIARLNAAMPPEAHYLDGIDFRGKTVGIIGHMHGTDEMHAQAKKVYIIERVPQQGDYPDAACDFILPQCDVAIITGSSIINKTLPHLLSLCPDAYTVLTGPSVPLCPALLDCGIDRISGLAVTAHDAIFDFVQSGRRGSPYGCGVSFMLCR